MAHSELAQEIRQLAERLNRGEVKFLDVLEATQKRIAVADGTVHYEEDKEILEALASLAREIARAWQRDGIEIVKGICTTVSGGVPSGRYGPEFFRRIRPE